MHLIDSVHGRENIRTRLSDVGGDAASPLLYPRHTRPAIWQHPILHVPTLFVLQQQASHIEGWNDAASDALLDEVFSYLYAPATLYVHDWRPKDLIVWDNIAVQHGRRANPRTVRRSLRRVAMNTVTTADLIRGSGFDPAVRASP